MTDLTFGSTYLANCGLVNTSRGFEVVLFGGNHGKKETHIYNVDQGNWVTGTGG